LETHPLPTIAATGDIDRPSSQAWCRHRLEKFQRGPAGRQRGSESQNEPNYLG
jgi:hypothetical protein